MIRSAAQDLSQDRGDLALDSIHGGNAAGGNGLTGEEDGPGEAVEPGPGPDERPVPQSVEPSMRSSNARALLGDTI
jgi:hypothetical protein